jgi:hypothetical protein
MSCGRFEVLGLALVALAASGTTSCGGKSCGAIPPCPSPGFDPSTCECISPGRGGAGEAGTSGSGGAGGGGASGYSGAGGAAEAGAGGLDCRGAACPAVIGVCTAGYRTPVGQCCASCIPDSTDTCAQGQSNYQTFSQTQIGQNSSCNVDADCVAVTETNACSANGCGDFIALSVSAQASIVSTLNNFAENHCSLCPPLAPESCTRAKTVLSCVNSTCTLVNAATPY